MKVSQTEIAATPTPCENQDVHQVFSKMEKMNSSKPIPLTHKIGSPFPWLLIKTENLENVLPRKPKVSPKGISLPYWNEISISSLSVANISSPKVPSKKAETFSNDEGLSSDLPSKISATFSDDKISTPVLPSVKSATFGDEEISAPTLPSVKSTTFGDEEISTPSLPSVKSATFGDEEITPVLPSVKSATFGDEEISTPVLPSVKSATFGDEEISTPILPSVKSATFGDEEISTPILPSVKSATFDDEEISAPTLPSVKSATFGDEEISTPILPSVKSATFDEDKISNEKIAATFTDDKISTPTLPSIKSATFSDDKISSPTLPSKKSVTFSDDIVIFPDNRSKKSETSLTEEIPVTLSVPSIIYDRETLLQVGRSALSYCKVQVDIAEIIDENPVFDDATGIKVRRIENIEPLTNKNSAFKNKSWRNREHQHQPSRQFASTSTLQLMNVKDNGNTAKVSQTEIAATPTPCENQDVHQVFSKMEKMSSSKPIPLTHKIGSPFPWLLIKTENLENVLPRKPKLSPKGISLPYWNEISISSLSVANISSPKVPSKKAATFSNNDEVLSSDLPSNISATISDDNISTPTLPSVKSATFSDDVVMSFPDSPSKKTEISITNPMTMPLAHCIPPILYDRETLLRIGRSALSYCKVHVDIAEIVDENPVFDETTGIKVRKIENIEPPTNRNSTYKNRPWQNRENRYQSSRQFPATRQRFGGNYNGNPAPYRHPF